MKKLLFLLLTIALIATSASAAKKEKAPKKGKEPAPQQAATAPDPYPDYKDGTFFIIWGTSGTVNDPMKGEGTTRFFRIMNDSSNSGSKSTVPYELAFDIRQFGSEVIYKLGFETSDYNFGSIPDGLIFNVDGNRTVLRTKDNSVRAVGTSLYYNMTFILDKATFERLANAKELFEYTPMVGDKYFKPVTLKGDALNAAKASMRRVIDNDNLYIPPKK